MTLLSFNAGNDSIKTCEIWDHIRAERRMLLLSLLSLSLICIVFSIALVLVAKRPPDIVTVDDLGKAAYIDNRQKRGQAAGREEIDHVIETFLSNYIAPDSEIIEYQLSQAMNLMTANLQRLQKEDLEKNEGIERIKKAGIRTELKLEKTNIEQDTGALIYVKVWGTRNMYPKDSLQEKPEVEGFKVSLRLRRVPRTKETPNALLIDDIRSEIIPIETVKAWKATEIPDIRKGLQDNE
ncbi:MAG: hypothetical protein Q7T03_03585 [Deltaproteobacteria bacterium]|nr:hypothetical protein [Deltaproteobacteria bacterium]